MSSTFLILSRSYGPLTKISNNAPLETASVSPSLSITSSPNNLSPHPSLIHSGQPSSFPSMVHSFFPAHTIKSNSPTNEFSQFPTIHPTKLWTSPPTSNGPSLRPSGQSFQSPTIYPSQEPFIIPASETRTSFFVMADRYRLNQYPELIEAMSHIPADVDFAIHLGDFNNVLNGCNDTSYKEFRDLLVQNMPISTFVIPGDNELNDCPNPIEAWEHWNTYILNIETHWDDSSYKVTRQRGNEENFAFRLKSVLCIGLNMVGGKILDRAQWKIQMDNNVHWVESQISAYEEQGFDALVIFGHASDSSRYDYFFEKLVNEVKQNGVPTIYIHESNEHFELSNHAFNTSNFWIASVRGGFLPFANVIVDTGKPEPFTLIINALR